MAIKPKSRAHEDRIKALELRIYEIERYIAQHSQTGITSYMLGVSRDKNYPSAESRRSKWWQFWK